MALKRISVKNFQSIPEADVEIGSFTVFTGPSSSGKSAFMRAAAALARNDFTPTQVRQGTRTTTVSMEFEDHTVAAERGKSKSTYMLDDEKFTKAGRAVPEQVQEALRMPLVGGVEATFSTQFDKPFLIAEPGALAATVLGSLTNVSVLHSAIKEAIRRNLAVGARIKAEEEHGEEISNDLEQFTHLDEILADLSVTENYLEELSSLDAAIKKMDELLSDIRVEATALKEAKSKVVDLSDLEAGVTSLTTKVEHVGGLASLVREIGQAQDQMPTQTYVGVDAIDLSGIEAMISELLDLNNFLDSVTSSVKQLRTAKEQAEHFTTEVQEKEAERARLLVEIGVCPTCGASIDKGDMHDNG